MFVGRQVLVRREGLRPQQGLNDEGCGDQADERVAHGDIVAQVRLHGRPMFRLVVLMTGALVLASAGYALAQFRGRGLDRNALAPAQFPDGDVVDLPARLHRGAPLRGGLADGLPAGRA